MKHFPGMTAAAAMLCAIVANPAHAQVRYDLTAFSSFNGYTGSFSYTAPTFITGETHVALAALNTCTVSPGYVCRDQAFYTDTTPFTATPSDMVAFGTSGGNSYYYFADGALGAAGIYDSIIFGTDQAARLVITNLGTTVPEAGTWAMMIGGLGIVGAAMRRRRTTAASRIA